MAPKWNEDPDEMLLYAVFHLNLLFAKTKTIFRERNTILFGNSNLCPIRIFNETSQAYYINPEEIIHWYIKVISKLR